MSDPARLVEDFEAWADAACPTDPAGRAQKHARMASSAFAFLRGSYAVWLATLAAGPASVPSPALRVAIGDVHAENFGVWPAAGGQAFGVNDYDEAGPGQAGDDLLRVAVSAILAVKDGRLALSPDAVVEAICDGYRARPRPAAGIPLERPDVLPEAFAALDRRWRRDVPTHQRFWAQLEALPAYGGPLPDEATALLPPGFAVHTRRRRLAGLGSRDRPRVVVLGRDGGRRRGFELKPLVPRAAAFAAGEPARPDATGYAALLASGAAAAPQVAPRIAVGERLTCRELSRRRGRIELTALRHRHLERELLSAMGAALAAVHALTADAAELSAYAAALDPARLLADAAPLHAATEEQFAAFREEARAAAR